MSTALLPAIHASVESLTTRTLDFAERDSNAPSTLALADRDLDILHVLAELRYLTTTMIAALAWGAYSSRLRERLHALFNAGLIRRFRPPLIPGAGGAQWIYELDTKGHRALKDRRPDRCPDWTRSEIYSFSYCEHDLELNALICELAARAAAACNRTGPLLHAAPFAMHGPRTGRIDPDHDARPLDADPTNELPPGHLVHPGTSHPGLLEPDATLLGRHRATGRPIAVLIEYDRTRKATKLTGKLARYDHFLTDGWRRTRYARHPDEPAVLFITRTDEHLPNVLREADRQLTAHAGTDSDPTRTRYPGREELAFTSRRRLLEGEDTILQTTPRASRQARTAQATTPSLQARLPLSTLFE
jgi:hypothetical protein